MAILALALLGGACSAQPSSAELPGNVLWVRNFIGTDAGLLRVSVDADDAVSMALLLRGATTVCDQEVGLADPEAVSLVVLRFASVAECPLTWARTVVGDWQSMLEQTGIGPARLGLAPIGMGGLLLNAGGLLGTFEFDAAQLSFTEPGGIVARLDGADGTSLWTRALVEPDHIIEPRDVVADGADNAYVIASRIDTTLPDEPGLDLWVARLDPVDGQTRWELPIGALPEPAGGAAAALASRISAGEPGTVIISGSYVGALDFGPNVADFQDQTAPSLATTLDELTVPARFVAYLDATDGSPLWARSFDDGHFGELQLAADATGGVLVLGNFEPPEDWQDLGTDDGEWRDGEWMTLARLQTDGEPDWVRGWHATWGFIESTSIAVDGDDNILLSGAFDGSWEFGSRPLVSYGGPALFVGKLAADGRERWARFSAFTGPVAASDVCSTSAGAVLGSGLFVPPLEDDGAEPTEFVLPSEPFLLLLAP